MASDKAWLEGIRRAAEATGNIEVTVMRVGLVSNDTIAAQLELERKVLAIKAICPPEHLDAALREAENRADSTRRDDRDRPVAVTAEEALDSVYADLTRGWLPATEERR